MEIHEDERKAFDREVAEVHGGNPLRACAFHLGAMASTLPSGGSLAAQCALMAEHVGHAAEKDLDQEIELAGEIGLAWWKQHVEMALETLGTLGENSPKSPFIAGGQAALSTLLEQLAGKRFGEILAEVHAALAQVTAPHRNGACVCTLPAYPLDEAVTATAPPSTREEALDGLREVKDILGDSDLIAPASFVDEAMPFLDGAIAFLEVFRDPERTWRVLDEAGFFAEMWSGKDLALIDPDDRAAFVRALGVKLPAGTAAARTVLAGRVRHWHAAPLDGGGVNPDCPYRGNVHDPGTDERLDFEPLRAALRELPEGTVVRISLEAEPAEPAPDDVWELVKPHTYGRRGGKP